MSTKIIPKKTVTLIEPKQNLLLDKEKYRQKKAAAYCRVSTGSEEQLTSYKTQMSVYTEMIAENPEWEFAGLYADEGISGTRADKRPQFSKMINDCLNGKIDIIITKSVSRFARNTVECLEYVRMLKARGIGIIFEEQNINTLKTDSELYLVIYAGFAQSESESMSKNITWAYRKNFENGKAGFCFSKFLGYRRGDDGSPEIVPEEAAAVREIFTGFAVFLLNEREKLYAAIREAKRSLETDIDSETSLNVTRQSVAKLFSHMVDLSGSETVTQNGGLGYRFNAEGNQVSYKCDVRTVRTIHFDRNLVKKYMLELSRKADAVSTEIDRSIVNTEVDYECPFDVNSSFAEALEQFIEKAS